MQNILKIFISLLFCFIAHVPLKAEYHDFQSFHQALQELENQHSSILDLETIGVSLGGRDIFAVTIGTGDSDNKPALAVVAGVEGADIVASEVALQFIRSLTSAYGQVDSVTALLDLHTIYVLPRVNPDAAESFFESPAYARKFNAHNLDADKDRLVDEDGYNDLNQDGVISLMRVEDPAGDWIADPDYPELLRKSDPATGETGKYLLFSEGVDDDKDGKLNEDLPGGVNFNQNFTYQYSYFRDGSGLHQVSENNTRAVADFFYNHKNIAAVFTFSPHDNLLHPWNAKPGSADENEPLQNVLAEDETYFNELSGRFQTISGLKDAPAPSRGNGAFSEWAYYHFGRWSVSVPAWYPPVINAGSDSTEEAGNAEKDLQKYSSHFQNQVRLFEWLQETNQDSRIISWTEIDHPDYPDKTVEVGGIHPYAGMNPPADSIDNISERFKPYLIYLTQSLPKVQVDALTVEEIDNNVYRSSATITNSGLLPTSTQIGTRIQWMPKTRVELHLSDDQQLASGRPLTILNKIERASGGEEIRWLVVGKRNSTVELTAGSPAGGMITRTITLR